MTIPMQWALRRRMIINTGRYIQPIVSTAPGSTPAYYFRGMDTFWWPVADTVISAIEMYNTD